MTTESALTEEDSVCAVWGSVCTGCAGQGRGGEWIQAGYLPWLQDEPG